MEYQQSRSILANYEDSFRQQVLTTSTDTKTPRMEILITPNVQDHQKIKDSPCFHRRPSSTQGQGVLRQI